MVELHDLLGDEGLEAVVGVGQVRECVCHGCCCRRRRRRWERDVREFEGLSRTTLSRPDQSDRR